jgi:hypothetical protein
MEMSHITFLLFATFSGLRMISYLPQIHRVAADGNGASAISYSTWALWTAANVATALYAVVNLHDVYLASVSVVYTVCCVVVIVLTAIKRRRYHGARHPAARVSKPRPAIAQPSKRHGPALGIALGAFAAIAIGFGAGWVLPHGISANSATTARHSSAEVIATASPSADEPAPTPRPAITRELERASITRAAGEPKPSPPSEAPIAADKREERELRFSVGGASIAVNKGRLRVRGPYGDFDIGL